MRERERLGLAYDVPQGWSRTRQKIGNVLVQVRSNDLGSVGTTVAIVQADKVPMGYVADLRTDAQSILLVRALASHRSPRDIKIDRV